MSAAALLADLRARGFTLTAAGERLLVAPADRLTDELRAAIRAQQRALLAVLWVEAEPVDLASITRPWAAYQCCLCDEELRMAEYRYGRLVCGNCLASYGWDLDAALATLDVPPPPNVVQFGQPVRRHDD